ncbi:hypothetical protein NDU88_003533 [Pleurodeles waltl]|uniref:Uncharacterized protein n=1 Tax=Pleurodeles waltl TaxID=8319 RepID=A0AAV7NKY4_PLEWA|nr:hypothetical protein NDU88_003533 [Pleurodeles waltl]
MAPAMMRVRVCTIGVRWNMAALEMRKVCGLSSRVTLRRTSGSSRGTTSEVTSEFSCRLAAPETTAGKQRASVPQKGKKKTLEELLEQRSREAVM